MGEKEDGPGIPDKLTKYIIAVLCYFDPKRVFGDVEGCCFGLICTYPQYPQIAIVRRELWRAGNSTSPELLNRVAGIQATTPRHRPQPVEILRTATEKPTWRQDELHRHAVSLQRAATGPGAGLSILDCPDSSRASELRQSINLRPSIKHLWKRSG